jgi:hypothetical protein
MTTGDRILILDNVSSDTFAYSKNEIVTVTAGNTTGLADLVTKGLASILSQKANYANTYKAIVSQSGTSAPTKTEYGTITTATWARSSAGIFTCTKTGAFTNATRCKKPNFPLLGVDTEFTASLEKTSADVLTLKVYDAGGNLVDGFSTLLVEAEVD